MNSEKDFTRWYSVDGGLFPEISLSSKIYGPTEGQCDRPAGLQHRTAHHPIAFLQLLAKISVLPQGSNTDRAFLKLPWR